MKALFRLIVALIVFGSLALYAEPSSAQSTPRRPRGLYAVVPIDGYLEAHTSDSASDLHAYFTGLYPGLLSNPADSGLAIQVGWNVLNPNPPSNPQAYDWSYLDDAFSAVGTWNSQNPGQAPKTIQVQVFPGYFTPQWLLDQIPSCDGLFQSPAQTPPSDCGKATFEGFMEPHDDLSVLPLPWNATYKNAYKTFLTAFAARYLSNPAFVSIDVAGPTAASSEIIEPTDSRTPPQTQFGGMSANDMWLKLLALAYADQPSYQNSDQAFIDEWEAAIDLFGQIFSGVTLVATPGAGLPNFGNKPAVPSALREYCPNAPDMDCVAEATILAYFAEPSVGGNNAKAVQSSGLDARSTGIGNLSPKHFSQATAKLTSPSAQILGAFQFGTSVARATLNEGCTSKFPPDRDDASGNKTPIAAVPVSDIPPACLAPGVTIAQLANYKQYSDVPAIDLISTEQGLYNVLKVYFEDTPAAAWFGGEAGTIPMNYLQIYAEDFEYAADHASTPVQIVEANGATVSMSAQDLLNLASQKLLTISEPAQ